MTSPSFVLFGIPNGLPGTRLGITVTRKYGGAVERTRAKRVVREIFRRNRSVLVPCLDLVVNVRSALRDAPFDRLEREFVDRFLKLARGFQP